ncbi:MAG TPA: hypothetical protein VE084_20715, partial [Burkholderiaceae bacterium]|nr:hypothetical protein [Burkholderiaceae bacterium]
MAVVAPFLVTPRLSSYATSTVLHRPAPPPESVGMNALRRLFFAGPWAPVAGYAADWLRAEDSADAQLNLLAALFMKLNARAFVAEAAMTGRSGQPPA